MCNALRIEHPDPARAGSSARLALAPRRGWRVLACIAVAAATGLGFASSAAAAEQAAKRVLIVHSFGRDIAPYDAVVATFRRELASRASGPIVFLEAVLDAGRPIGANEEAAFAAYLAARFSQPPPDLIVGSAGPAAQFLIHQRKALFPTVPRLMTAIDDRVAPHAGLEPGDAVVATKLDVPHTFDALLQVLPRTRTIAVVVGDTPIERFWRAEAEHELAHLADRVHLVWFDGLSLAQIEQRIAALAPDSAVLYGLLIVDGAGVPHERLEALAALKHAAKVPVFSMFENELGRGVVGGPFMSQTRVGRETARLALRSLSASPPAAPEFVAVGMADPVYDGRELARWGIDESRLPPGSEVRFRQPSPWVRYRDEIISIAVVIVTQSVLIAALLVQRTRRRRAEHEARALGGRLITAHEDAGRRLARELHDDVTQRLAALSIDAAMLDRQTDPAQRAHAQQSISGGLADLSRDVHALSYRLHPSVIDDLGLGEALRIECGRIARADAVDASFEGDAASGAIRGDRALCLFRIAQEALRNAARHAHARRVRVELHAEGNGTMLCVTDDGVGFDASAPRAHASLGLASMRERVALLGGRIEIRSRRGEGTRVAAWLPDAEPTP